jgi:fatty acid-binding protein DegV
MAAHIDLEPGPLRAAVGHASAATAAAADALADELECSGSIVDVLRYRVGPSVGAHTGSLSFGAFWWPASP